MSAFIKISKGAAYTVAFRAIIFATRKGLDVRLLGSRMDALIFEPEHPLACLQRISTCIIYI
jgi:hypothetical protein